MVTVDVKLHQDRAERDLPRPRLVIGGKDVTDASGGVHEHRQPGDRPRPGARSRSPGRAEVDRAVAAARQAFEVLGRHAARRAPPAAHPLRRSCCATTSPTSRRSARWRTASASAAGRRTSAPHVAEWTEYYAGWADKIEGMVGAAYSPHENVEYTIAEPYGVIGHIITWNSPALSLAMKVPPSLAAGNTVVIKPAESTPFSALLLRRPGPRGRVSPTASSTSSPAWATPARRSSPTPASTRSPSPAARRPRAASWPTAAQSLKPVALRAGRQVRQPALRRRRPGRPSSRTARPSP